MSLFVGIEGPIAVGKTTLARKIERELGYHPMHEPVEENPYLELFYQDMARWGGIMQLHLLHHRYLDHLGARVRVAEGTSVVQDRTIFGDTVFAENLHEAGLMSDLEWGTYRLAWRAMDVHVVRPDVILFLDAPAEALMARVRTRNRPCERDMRLEYLAALRKRYVRLHVQMERQTDCLMLDWTDPECRVPDVLALLRGIEQHRPPFGRERVAARLPRD